jgi:hypothetical protein
MDTKAKTLQRQNQRLLLSRETVRTLSPLDLTGVAGGDQRTAPVGPIDGGPLR